MVIAGRMQDSWRSKIEAAVERKGGSDQVVFVDDPSLEAQRQQLAAATMLASPALVTRCPVSVMQALACGVPVIASEHTDPFGLDSQLSFVRPGRDELRAALSELLGRDPNDLREAAAGARDAAKKVCDWSVRAAAFARLYESAQAVPA